MPSLLRLKALQPPIQRLIKEVPARLPKRNRSPEIIAMLRILQHIPKDLILILLLSALRRLGEGLRLGSPGLGRQRGERAPGVEFTAGPVQLRGTDVPAAKDGVGAVGLRPFGEEGGFGGGELAVTDVALVGEGVVLGDELVGTEVGGLEVACGELVFWTRIEGCAVVDLPH